MKLYALFDKKAQALSAFQVARSDAQVSRDFAQAVLDPNGMLGKYPDDFELVVIAEVFENVAREAALAQVAPADMRTVITARQVVDAQVKAPDNGQLSLLKEG